MKLIQNIKTNHTLLTSRYCGKRFWTIVSIRSCDVVIAVLQCFICTFRGPGTKRGDGSGMCLEEGEVTEHSADHIGGPA